MGMSVLLNPSNVDVVFHDGILTVHASGEGDGICNVHIECTAVGEHVTAMDGSASSAGAWGSSPDVAGSSAHGAMGITGPLGGNADMAGDLVPLQIRIAAEQTRTTGTSPYEAECAIRLDADPHEVYLVTDHGTDRIIVQHSEIG